jgi:hypothetical protein
MVKILHQSLNVMTLGGMALAVGISGGRHPRRDDHEKED